MRFKRWLYVALLCLLLVPGTVEASTDLAVSIGHQDNGVYTDLSAGTDVGKFSLTLDALEATINDMVDRYTYMAGEFGYSFGKLTPFVAIVKANKSHYLVVDDGEKRVQQELLSEQIDSGLGVGISGEFALGKVTFDGSCRAFNHDDQINTLLKTNFKYRVGDNSFLSIGHISWNNNYGNVFGGMNFGMQMGF